MSNFLKFNVRRGRVVQGNIPNPTKVQPNA